MAKITIEIDMEGCTPEELRKLLLIQTAYDYECLTPPLEAGFSSENMKIKSLTVKSKVFAPITLEEIQAYMLKPLTVEE